MSTSKHLSPAQLKGLLKVGDVLVPGLGNLPSFSAAQAVGEADRMFDYMNEADRQGLKSVLSLFRFLPRWLLRLIFFLATHHRLFPGPLGAAFRMINIGVKGCVMTLYYSDLTPDGTIYREIGWDAKIVEREEAPGEAATEPSAARESDRSFVGPRRPSPKEAFERARSGRASLARLTVEERAKCLRELSRVILRRREEIVERIQADTGKSRLDALVSEVFGALDCLHWLSGHGKRALRERRVRTPWALLGKRSRIWFEPLGTVLVISPWNYPFYQAIVPIASAFLAGNTVVYKPSEWTPLEGLIEDCLHEAQFAPNWVQIVYGDGSVGRELIEERPDKVFFTGSTRTGRSILAQAAPLLVPVELELGGKDPMVVFEDANVERAAAAASWGAFTNTGQSCTSVERLYVQEAIYEPLKHALLEEVRRIRQGVDRDGNAEIGGMTTDFQVAVVRRHVEDARAKGARFLCGQDWDGSSRMIPPMVVEDVTDEMLLFREETFGPVLPLFKFRSEDEAVELANKSPYGLSASVWSKDLERARRVAARIVTGNVSINNVMITEGNPALPFGGTKESGFGRYKGEQGLHAFCNIKSVMIDRDSGKIEANWYPYTREKYLLFDTLIQHLFRGGPLSFFRFALTGLRLEGYCKRARESYRNRAR